MLRRGARGIWPLKLMPDAVKRIVNTIPAIHASAGVEHWYKRTLEALVFEAHLEIVRVINNARHIIVGRPVTVTKVLGQDAPDPTVRLNRQLLAWAKKWNYKFDSLSVGIAQKFAGKSFAATEEQLRAALKSKGFTISFHPTPASIAAYRSVAAENVQLIRSIPSQYLTNVQSAVWASVNRGGDMGELSKRLTKEYNITQERAALISRDQNNKAKAVIEQTRRMQLGITEAIWQHSSGGKEPRPTHVAMNGKVFTLKTGMYDSEEKSYVLPGQLINCRCTSRAIIPGFNDNEGTRE